MIYNARVWSDNALHEYNNNIYIYGYIHREKEKEKESQGRDPSVTVEISRLDRDPDSWIVINETRRV